MASFKSIDYSLRPNKNVERKIIAESLQLLTPQFDIRDYLYVGLGAIWFTDFVLFHRSLFIQEMISIQAGAEEARRARLNRPLRSIRVEEGYTTTVLPELPLSEKNFFIWLDYDSGLRGPVKQDVPIIADNAKAGDVFLVTLNAAGSQLHLLKKGGEVTDRREILAELTGVPMVKISAGDTESVGFPQFIAKFLIQKIESDVRKSSGGRLRFRPLYNMRYADGAQMVTVGGMILDDPAEERLESTKITSHPSVTIPNQLVISLPLLTHRERLLFDRRMPWDGVESFKGLKRLGFDEDDLHSYKEYYNHYPAFAEMIIS